MFYETVLHYACRSGNCHIVRFLVSLQKIDLDAKNVLFFMINIISIINICFTMFNYQLFYDIFILVFLSNCN